MIQIRALEIFDEPLLPRFLALAAHEEEIEVVLANPALALYVENWGRAGDCAVVAEDTESRAVVGMAWARFWTPEHHGFGWVDELTPEMAVAVEAEFQGQGIGTRLVEALKCRLRAILRAARWDARHQQLVCATRAVEVEQPEMLLAPDQVILNVRDESPAVRLYERLGFFRVAGSERQNRTGGVSFNMSAPLQKGNWRQGEMARSIHTNWAGAPADFISINYSYGLRFDLFTRDEHETFIELMVSLPGTDADLWKFDGFDRRTTWSYFGPAPVKAAIHWAHLAAFWQEGQLRVYGDLKAEDWARWEDAFLKKVHSFPYDLLTTASE